ncbi:hypothetical protein BH10PSE9_BH10PSE9_14100 [soil metagenome]
MAKRVAPLSAARLRNLKPGSSTIELVDGEVPGLRVRMTPSGAVSWSLNVRDSKGRRRRFDVGRGLGLAAARREANALRQRIRGGTDPTAEKRANRVRARNATMGVGSFGAIVAAYFASGPGSVLHTRREQERRIRSVFAEHLLLPAADISPSELQLTADQHPSASSAGHAIAYLRPLTAWASRRDLMKKGFDDLERPTILSVAGAADTVGQRFLSPDELALIWPALGRSGYDAGVRFMLLTGCRLDEACRATWSEIDLEKGL